MKPAPTRVLVLHTGDNWLRGSEGVLLDVLGRLDPNQFEKRVICNQPAMATAVSNLGISSEIREFPRIFVDSGEISLPLGRWIAALRNLCRTVREYRPDVIYCNSGSSNQLGVIAGARTGVPVVSHLHSPYETRFVRWFLIHRASAVICVSRAVASIATSGVRFRQDPVIVYNGVNTDRFRPTSAWDPEWRRRLNIPPDAFVWGQVSSLISRKGVDLLLQARARLSHGYVVIVGEGPERAAFEELAGSLGIAANVKFVGLADPVPYYQHVFDVSVLPSRNDALPLSLIEASACGLPSIGARVHGIPEIIEDQVSGLLFEAGDVDGLAAAMSRFSSDPAFRSAAGRAALGLARSRFSLERQVNEIGNLLKAHAGSRALDVTSLHASENVVS